MSETIAVKWTVQDGYLNNGTHTTKMDARDFTADMTDDEILEVVGDNVQHDFEQRVSPDFDFEKALEAVRAALDPSHE